MLPLLLLRTAQSKACLIELKSGDTFNGILVSVDNWMNMCLKDCIKTSKAGDKFWKCNSIYIRGNQIKYIRLAEEVIDDPALEKHSSNFKTSSTRGRGGRGRGRGRGRGGPGGGPGDDDPDDDDDDDEPDGDETDWDVLEEEEEEEGEEDEEEDLTDPDMPAIVESEDEAAGAAAANRKLWAKVKTKVGKLHAHHAEPAWSTCRVSI